ncbi:MAG: ImmA/IrrE family metallo-endopeptidase [Chloroflexota bacterium]|nr:ImmA/IrrE family metallo-endopeptidase [Chloroflexota bacterium]
MRWYSDPTGRFPQRPFYENDDLDQDCETIIAEFLLERYGRVAYPIDTNDLVVLLEQVTDDLDLYADLSTDGPTVEGKTLFSSRGKPRVLISTDLQAPHRENRLRTTLAHELGHVKFHNYLYGLYAGAPSPCCSSDTIIGASSSDWLEWQAGYCSVSFLMPLRALRRTVREVKKEAGVFGEPIVGSTAGQTIIQRVQNTYQVSAEAARVRLLRAGFLTEG